MGLLSMLRRTLFPASAKKPKPFRRPPRVSVHLRTGETVVHYANHRTLRNNGGLSLHNAAEGGYVVAEYAPGEWSSISLGTRKVSTRLRPASREPV